LKLAIVNLVLSRNLCSENVETKVNPHTLQIM